jgi:hypothetical protein
MRHLIAPSSMREVAPTSIHSSSQKGMRTHHPKLSRSRRDTSSLSFRFKMRGILPPLKLSNGSRFKSGHNVRAPSYVFQRNH